MTTTCGSIAGYTRHRRQKEPTCIECKAAWRDYYRELRRRKHEEELSKNDTSTSPNSPRFSGVVVSGDGVINWDLVP